MISLKDKIAFITGASSGIGKSTAEQFAMLGVKLILTARRIERINELADKLIAEYGIDVLSIQLDIQNKDEVRKTIGKLPKNWQNIDILVNNAGLAITSDPIQAGILENWDQVIDTNLKGLLYVTREILTNMSARNTGHIINIGSIAGHEYYPGGNIYIATKHAVKAISKTLKLDLLGTNIRVTEIAPGLVHTEFSEVRWQDKQRADNFYKDFQPLYAEDIADAVVYSATRPLHVDIAEMIILPTCQASTNHVAKVGQKAANMFD